MSNKKPFKPLKESEYQGAYQPSWPKLADGLKKINHPCLNAIAKEMEDFKSNG